MPLKTGQTLQNRYRIVTLLGQGGMGAVYRAWDTRLNVPVALKEMIPQPGLDPTLLNQLRQQFQQEATVLARLNHPHLVNVTDFFEEQGNAYLVMRFIEGESLANRILREGPIPEEQVRLWAIQLLDALSYCHSQGILHRDIKPQNIIIRPDGQAIFVDFGLVKLWNPDDPRTRTAMRGMGTPEYAPPEQYEIRGSHTDARSDIYALGATLYHALTGQVPPTATMRIVNPQALQPVRTLRPNVSPAMEAALNRALELQPNGRFQSAAEMVQALQGRAPIGTAVLPSGEEGAKIISQIPLWGWVIGAIILLMVGGGVILAVGGPAQETPKPEATQTTTPISTPNREVEPGTTETPLPTSTPAPTPLPTETPMPSPTPTPSYTGRIVFTRNPPNDRGQAEIYLRDLETNELLRLTNNDVSDWIPEWSWDGTLITFGSYQAGNHDVWIMRGDGSNQRAAITLDAWDDYPVWSPDDSLIAFVSTGMTAGQPNSEIYVSNLAGDIWRATTNTGRDEWPDWAPDGRWLACSSDRDGNMEIYLFTFDGEEIIQWTDTSIYEEQPTWSPNGEWIAFIRKERDTNGDGNLTRRDDGDFGDVWVGRRDGSEFRQLTSGHLDADPTWSPDGRYLVFTRVRDTSGDGNLGLDDASDLWIISVEDGALHLLAENPQQDWAPDWGR
ncbi:MAG: protein kinase domain-containing protein [Anaerolineae bacterium]